MDRFLVRANVQAVRSTSLHQRAVLIACGLMLLCSGLSNAKDNAIFTEFSGTITAVGMANPGTLECLQGQPTGTPWYLGTPCSPADSRVRIRGVVLKYYEATSDPRMTGWLFVTINANLDQWPGSGPFWGTARLELASGDVWEGNWTGERALTTETMHAVLHGSRGAVEGLKCDTHMLLISKGPAKYSIAGTIIEPPAK